MLTQKQINAINLLRYQPLKVAKLFGFDKLTELHNDWMRDFINGEKDITLQAHRGSYKTTAVSIAIAIKMILRPNKDILFCRKTDGAVKEVVRQIKNILLSETMGYFVKIIYGCELCLVEDNATQLTTNLRATTRGSSQLMGLGTNSQITGKHFDYIFTDDIIDKKDRFSKAEREATKVFYMELQNIKNRGGRMVNTGTPWHKEDAFSIMPEPVKYDCYSTGLMSKEEIAELRHKLSNSLFAVNYELKHIASEDALFKSEPKFFNDIKLLENSIGHIDASYGGEDSTAFTVAKKVGVCYYLYGKKREKHIDDCLDEFLAIADSVKCGTIWSEINADKGYLKKEIIKKGHIADNYFEKMNKYVKISTFLKMNWDNVYFYEDTDSEYIQQILDYTEQAQHDDCPDSASSIIRKLDHNLVIV